MNRTHLILTILITLLALTLRLAFFGQSPPSLYWDEVSLGYNAYSIAQTGQDEHGVFFPLWFQAYGEYKLPVYIYTTAILIKFFGFSDLVVRLPSVIAGSLSPLAIYFLLFHLVSPGKKSPLKHTPILASFFLAISPWSIQFSRAAFEANLALFFTLSATALFLAHRPKKLWPIHLSLVLFFLSIFTYNSARIFVPIWLVYLFTRHFQLKLTQIKKPLAIFIFLFALTLPSQLGEQGQTRLEQTTFLFSQSISQSIHIFAQNTSSLLDTNFLFFHGDQIGRHSTRRLGMMHYFQVPLVILGLWYLFNQKHKLKPFVLLWLALGILPAAITQPNPHALRALFMLPALIIITSIAASRLIPAIRTYPNAFKYPTLGLFSIIITYNLALFTEEYFVRYPHTTALDWADGNQAAVSAAKSLLLPHQKLFVTTKLPPLYLASYLPIPPKDFHQHRIYPAQPGDQLTDRITYFQYYSDLPEETDFVAISDYNPNLLDKSNAQLITIQNGDPIFVVWSHHASP